VQLLASQDDVLMVMADAFIHEVFLDSDAVSIHEQGCEMSAVLALRPRGHRIYTECQYPLSSLSIR